MSKNVDKSLEDYQEDQWWIKNLESISYGDIVTLETRRSIQVTLGFIELVFKERNQARLEATSQQPLFEGIFPSHDYSLCSDKVRANARAGRFGCRRCVTLELEDLKNLRLQETVVVKPPEVEIKLELPISNETLRENNKFIHPSHQMSPWERGPRWTTMENVQVFHYQSHCTHCGMALQSVRYKYLDSLQLKMEDVDWTTTYVPILRGPCRNRPRPFPIPAIIS